MKIRHNQVEYNVLMPIKNKNKKWYVCYNEDDNLKIFRESECKVIEYIRLGALSFGSYFTYNNNKYQLLDDIYIRKNYIEKTYSEVCVMNQNSYVPEFMSCSTLVEKV